MSIRRTTKKIRLCSRMPRKTLGSRLGCLPLPFILGVPGRLVSLLECVSHFFSFVSQAGCLFLLFVSRFFCFPCLSLLISALFRWPCSISIHVPGLSLLVSALVRWPCSISILLSCRSVTVVCPCVLAMKHFYSFVCQVRHCWCHVAFICFPGPLLLLSALFRWPCSISIHLSPRSVTAGVRPFQHFYSLVSQVCHCWCPPFFRWRCNISIHLFSRSVTASALFRWPCSISIHLFPGSVTGAAALFRWPCSIPIHLSPM